MTLPPARILWLGPASLPVRPTRQLARVRVQGAEGPEYAAGDGIHFHADIHPPRFLDFHAIIFDRGLCRIILRVLGDSDHLVAPGDLGRAESRPIQVWVEIIGDGHLLRRCAGARHVLKVDLVLERLISRHIVLFADPGRTEFFVGIAGGDVFGRDYSDKGFRH